jgi:hypothetical protein
MIASSNDESAEALPSGGGSSGRGGSGLRTLLTLGNCVCAAAAMLAAMVALEHSSISRRCFDCATIPNCSRLLQMVSKVSSTAGVHHITHTQHHLRKRNARFITAFCLEKKKKKAAASITALVYWLRVRCKQQHGG